MLNNIKLVHLALMGGLLHLVHQGEEGTGLGCPAAYSSFQAYSAYSTIERGLTD